jgi:GGDEF domain-containing protein
MRLGDVTLATARVRAAAPQFVARPELVGTLLMHLVLARACRRVRPRRSGRHAEPLTGLGNRRVLDDFVDQTPGRAWAVFVDVDDFKRSNDTYSHAAT